MAPLMTTELSLVEFAFDAEALSVLACHDTHIAQKTVTHAAPHDVTVVFCPPSKTRQKSNGVSVLAGRLKSLFLQENVNTGLKNIVVVWTPIETFD